MFIGLLCQNCCAQSLPICSLFTFFLLIGVNSLCKKNVCCLYVINAISTPLPTPQGVGGCSGEWDPSETRNVTHLSYVRGKTAQKQPSSLAWMSETALSKTHRLSLQFVLSLITLPTTSEADRAEKSRHRTHWSLRYQFHTMFYCMVWSSNRLLPHHWLIQ